MITTIIGFLGSGAFGSIVGAFFGFLNRKGDQAHAQAMAALSNEQALALADKAREQVSEAGRQVVAATEASAFVESQKAAIEQWRWVRPVLTCYLVGVMTYLAIGISSIVGGLDAFDKTAMFALYSEVVGQVFFLVNLAVSWWFGARGSSPRTK